MLKPACCLPPPYGFTGDSDAAAPGPFSPQQRKELGEALTRAVVSALAAAAKGQHQHEGQKGQAERHPQLDCFSCAWLLHVQHVGGVGRANIQSTGRHKGTNGGVCYSCLWHREGAYHPCSKCLTTNHSYL